MIRVVINMRLGSDTSVDIAAESPYSPADKPMLDYVVNQAVKQAEAALAAQR